MTETGPLHVPTAAKSIGDYAAVVGRDVVAELREKAEPFKGARILNVNSTAYGGGVAELLYTLVPLMRDLGIDADWRLMAGHDAFFHVTKAMHNALQGATVPWTPEMEATYRAVTEDNAESFPTDYDFVIIHDSQPAGILREIIEDHGPPSGKWMWRCHIDLTETFPPVWDFVKPMVDFYDAAIFTLEDFVKPGLEVGRTALIPPSIDPLSVKNIPMDPFMVEEVMRRYQIDMNRPLIVQVSRFDPWKDPMGVIDAYRIVREAIPGVQLALIASMAHDDPEGWEVYTRVDEYREGDEDIHLLSNLQEVGGLAVNAFQRAADVVVQKSLREGFGLVVAEAMWKRKPVVGGNAGGIRLQILDGQTGFLVDSVQQCAERIIHLLRDPEAARVMSSWAHEHVKQNFLSTRHLMDYFDLFYKLSL
jgi:trehalose synthase